MDQPWVPGVVSTAVGRIVRRFLTDAVSGDRAPENFGPPSDPRILPKPRRINVGKLKLVGRKKVHNRHKPGVRTCF